MTQENQEGSKYGRFFRELNVVHGLQTVEQDRDWLLASPQGDVKPADIVLYHGCHRMLCGCEKDYPIKVEHYLTLVGRSLGIEYEYLFKKHMLMDDVDAIMLKTSPCATANGISEEDARAAILNSFVPKTG